MDLLIRYLYLAASFVFGFLWFKVKSVSGDEPLTVDGVGFYPQFDQKQILYYLFPSCSCVCCLRVLSTHWLCRVGLRVLEDNSSSYIRTSGNDSLQSNLMDKDAMFQHEIDKEVKFMTYRNNKDLATIRESMAESSDYKMTYTHAKAVMNSSEEHNPWPSQPAIQRPSDARSSFKDSLKSENSRELFRNRKSTNSAT